VVLMKVMRSYGRQRMRELNRIEYLDHFNVKKLQLSLSFLYFKLNITEKRVFCY
jgi:hypothetical protein